MRRARLGTVSDLDAYFPVEAHRRQWSGDAHLIVACAPVGDETAVKEIRGYRVANGEAVTLSATDAPAEVTLILAQPERPGEPRRPSVQPLTSGTDPPDEGASPPIDPYIGIPYLMLLDDQEPWWKGKPEIYVLVGQSHRTAPVTHKVYLDWVNSEDRWYYLGESPGGVLYFYFDSDYSDLIYFHFMEEDVGDICTVSASVGFGGVSVGLKFKITDGDDDLGYRYESKNAVPWGGYVDRNTGRAKYKLDKDP